MRRRIPRTAVPATGLRTGRPEPSRARGLSVCPHCDEDYVVPLQWEAAGPAQWWMFLRCAQCGMSREVVVPNADAAYFDQQLIHGMNAIRSEADRLELERMAVEAETFVAALHGGLVEPADFAV